MRTLLALLLIALPCSAQWRTPDNPNYALDAASLKEFQKHFEKKEKHGILIIPADGTTRLDYADMKYITPAGCELWEYDEASKRFVGARIDRWGKTDGFKYKEFQGKPGMKVWWSCEGWAPKEKP